MKYVLFSYECYPFPIAKHLKDEGKNAVVGIIENIESLRVPGMKDDEEPEDREQRLSNHDGILKKYTLKSVMNYLRKVKNKNDYFFFFDFNNMYKIAEDIMKMGFKNGLFPTETYYRLEKERELSKKFVKKFYSKVKVADYQVFKKVQDGIKKINESNVIYVLKSNGNCGKTIVPNTDDIKVSKKQLIDTLTKYKKEYEEEGFILENKIPDCLEVTPIMIFYNGKPIYSIVEFENKQYGSGNIGSQKGGNEVLSIQTDLDCKINKIAFPEVIYRMSKKQPGLSIYDAGLLYDGKDFWFTEFCAMRYGWDGIFSEMVMVGDNKPFVSEYFESIVKGNNPLNKKYGVALRMFNYEGDLEDTEDPVADEPITWDKSIDNNLFIYNAKKNGNDIVDTADRDFLACITASGNYLEDTVNKLYERVEKFNFEKLYYRPKFDFLSKDYRSSIPNRINAIKEFI